jgi:glycosyltransferase involved in cell wall biosynthesis
MHVVHLYDGHEQVYEGRGSVPGVVWHLARETAATGHDVTVIERQWDGLDAVSTHEGVDFERLDLWTGADEPWSRVPYEQVTSPVGVGQLLADRTNFARRALAHLRDRSFDVLHVHLPFAAAVLLTIAPGLRERTVYTAHLGELRLDALTDDQQGTDPAASDSGSETDDDSGGIETPSILSVASPDIYLARRTARTTVLNEGIADAFADRGVDPESLSVLPNGVDLDRFTNVSSTAVERVRESYAFGDGPTLLFVGTVMPRKGVVDLVRAAGILADRTVDAGDGGTDGDAPFDLIVAGEDELDGDYVDTVRETASDAGIADAVSFPGFVPAEDLPALYAATDLFVMPSLEEGFGMTVVEAMAAGTPVVGTRVGAIPEIVDDGDHGFVVDPGDPSGLADAMDEALERFRESDTIMPTTRQRAGEYSWASVGQRCRTIYESVQETV